MAMMAASVVGINGCRIGTYDFFKCDDFVICRWRTEIWGWIEP